MLNANHRIAILLHEGVQNSTGKTGLSLLRYSENPIAAVIDYESAGSDLTALTNIPLSVPIVATVEEALIYKPDVLAIGIAPSGGSLPEAWWEEIKQGVAAGLSIVNGLHTPMATHPELRNLLQTHQWIWDVRQEPSELVVGAGQAQSLPCRRVLMVGTDMAIGKMSAGLELHHATLKRGWKSKFLATGQTGLMLGHDGIPLDTIRVDFAAGAVERLVLGHGFDNDVLYIEGQGSLLNPASTATLPLLRGSQPTDLILVHRAGQTHIEDYPSVPIPPLNRVIRVYETITTAGGAFAETKVVAIALNTFHLNINQAKAAIEQVHQATGLPCTDAIRFGVEPILNALFPHD